MRKRQNENEIMMKEKRKIYCIIKIVLYSDSHELHMRQRRLKTTRQIIIRLSVITDVLITLDVIISLLISINIIVCHFLVYVKRVGWREIHKNLLTDIPKVSTQGSFAKIKKDIILISLAIF